MPREELEKTHVLTSAAWAIFWGSRSVGALLQDEPNPWRAAFFLLVGLLSVVHDANLLGSRTWWKAQARGRQTAAIMGCLAPLGIALLVDESGIAPRAATYLATYVLVLVGFAVMLVPPYLAAARGAC